MAPKGSVAAALTTAPKSKGGGKGKNIDVKGNSSDKGKGNGKIPYKGKGNRSAKETDFSSFDADIDSARLTMVIDEAAGMLSSATRRANQAEAVRDAARMEASRVKALAEQERSELVAQLEAATDEACFQKEVRESVESELSGARQAFTRQINAITAMGNEVHRQNEELNKSLSASVAIGADAMAGMRKANAAVAQAQQERNIAELTAAEEEATRVMLQDTLEAQLATGSRREKARARQLLRESQGKDYKLRGGQLASEASSSSGPVEPGCKQPRNA
jgi:hypothetical protein